MRFVLLISLCCFAGLPNLLVAQAYEDLIVLKDSTQITGEIIEHIPNERVKLRMIGGSELIYHQTEIAYIRKTPFRYRYIRYKRQSLPFPLPLKPSAFQTTLHFTFSPTVNRNLRERIDFGTLLMTTHQTKWHFLSPGAGIGLERNEAGWMVPVFVGATGTFFQQPFRLGYFAQAGPLLPVFAPRGILQISTGGFARVGLLLIQELKYGQTIQLGLAYGYRILSAVEHTPAQTFPQFQFQRVEPVNLNFDQDGFSIYVGMSF